MQVRLYLDEDAMDSDLVRALRVRGVDVATALDKGALQIPPMKNNWNMRQSMDERCIPSTFATSWAFILRMRRWANRTQGSFSVSNNITVSVNRCGVWSDLSKCDPLRVCAIQLSSSALGDKGNVS
jgi:hypothetical protein